jgi:hypothetical protein
MSTPPLVAVAIVPRDVFPTSAALTDVFRPELCHQCKNHRSRSPSPTGRVLAVITIASSHKVLGLANGRLNVHISFQRAFCTAFIRLPGSAAVFLCCACYSVSGIGTLSHPLARAA